MGPLEGLVLQQPDGFQHTLWILTLLEAHDLRECSLCPAPRDIIGRLATVSDQMACTITTASFHLDKESATQREENCLEEVPPKQVVGEGLDLNWDTRRGWLP